MGRWIRFLIAVMIGAAAGMFYGWKVNPVRYSETTPDSLRVDYKTDYVLMVAEAFRIEQDQNLAARRLALISTESPGDVVTKAIKEAKQIPYPAIDLGMMQDLGDAMLDWSPVPIKGVP
jgi:hypothetical protein